MHQQKIVAYTPQQNGVVEWTNRTLTKRMRVMLKTVGLPKTYWAKAVKLLAI